MNPHSTIANSTADIMIVTALCFGWFILVSLQAVASGFPSQPFTDAALFEIIACELVFAAAALGYLHLRGHDLAHFIPSPTVTGSLSGAGLFVAASLASWALTFAFWDSGAHSQPIDDMVAGATISFAPLIGVSLVNGLYEETFLVGYLQRALEGSGAAFAIGVTLLVRLLYHLYQGPVGALSVMAFGLVLSLFYLYTKRLWPLVFAHVLADITGLAFSL